MASPKGWKKVKRKRKSLKNYSHGTSIVSWSNKNSDLRDKATTERVNNILEDSGLLIHDLYGTEKQVEQFNQFEGHQPGFVTVVYIKKLRDREGGTYYSARLEAPFYNFSKYGYEDENFFEVTQGGSFGEVKKITLGFLRLVPTFTLADALVLDRDNPSSWLNEEQLKYQNIDDDWIDDMYDKAN